MYVKFVVTLAFRRPV